MVRGSKLNELSSYQGSVDSVGVRVQIRFRCLRKSHVRAYDGLELNLGTCPQNSDMNDVILKLTFWFCLKNIIIILVWVS